MDDVRESSLFLSTLQYLSIGCCGGPAFFIESLCCGDMPSFELTELSSILIIIDSKKREKKNRASTETRTRIVGFKVQSANHYTIEALHLSCSHTCL